MTHRPGWQRAQAASHGDQSTTKSNDVIDRDQSVGRWQLEALQRDLELLRQELRRERDLAREEQRRERALDQRERHRLEQRLRELESRAWRDEMHHFAVHLVLCVFLFYAIYMGVLVAATHHLL